MLDDLFARGIGNLPSDAVQKFYEALLRGLIAPLGLSDAAYRRVLSDGVEALGLPAEPICIDGGEVHAEHALSEPDSDEVLDAARGPLAPMGSAAPLPLALPPPPRSSSSSSSSSTNSSNSQQDSDEVFDVGRSRVR